MCITHNCSNVSFQCENPSLLCITLWIILHCVVQSDRPLWFASLHAHIRIDITRMLAGGHAAFVTLLVLDRMLANSFTSQIQFVYSINDNKNIATTKRARVPTVCPLLPRVARVYGKMFLVKFIAIFFSGPATINSEIRSYGTCVFSAASAASERSNSTKCWDNTLGVISGNKCSRNFSRMVYLVWHTQPSWGSTATDWWARGFAKGAHHAVRNS